VGYVDFTLSSNADRLDWLRIAVRTSDESQGIQRRAWPGLAQPLNGLMAKAKSAGVTAAYYSATISK
jgi:hypothetical protein